MNQKEKLKRCLSGADATLSQLYEEGHERSRLEVVLERVERLSEIISAVVRDKKSIDEVVDTMLYEDEEFFLLDDLEKFGL